MGPGLAAFSLLIVYLPHDSPGLCLYMMHGAFFHSAPGSFSRQGPSNWIPGVSVFVFLGTFSLDTENHSWILTVLGLLKTWLLYSNKQLWNLLITGVLLSHARPGRKTLGEEKGAEGILGWWEDGLLSIWQFCSQQSFPPKLLPA